MRAQRRHLGPQLVSGTPPPVRFPGIFLPLCPPGPSLLLPCLLCFVICMASGSESEFHFIREMTAGGPQECLFALNRMMQNSKMGLEKPPWLRGHRLDPWLGYLLEGHAGGLIPSPDGVPDSPGPARGCSHSGWKLEDVMCDFNYVPILSHIPERPC